MQLILYSIHHYIKAAIICVFPAAIFLQLANGLFNLFTLADTKAFHVAYFVWTTIRKLKAVHLQEHEMVKSSKLPQNQQMFDIFY